MVHAAQHEVQRAYELLCIHAVRALLREGCFDEALKAPCAVNFQLEGRSAVAAVGPGRPMVLVAHWGCARPAAALEALQKGLPVGKRRTMALGLLERRGRGLFLRPRRLGAPALRGKAAVLRALAEADDPRPEGPSDAELGLQPELAPQRAPEAPARPERAAADGANG